MKFADLKLDKLFLFSTKPRTTCLILSERRFQDNKKAKKRHWYYMAGFYNHETKDIKVERIKRTMMRAHMKTVDDPHLLEIIKTTSFTAML